MTPAPHITSLTATNLKRFPTLNLTLAPFTVITGANGSGKTSIADAIQLATIGCVPRMGRKGPSTAKLMGPGQTLAVSAMMSNALSYTRAWKRSKAGGLTKTDDKCPAATSGLPVICFDLEQFTAGNAQQRAAMIAARYGLEGDPKKTIMDAARKAWPLLPQVPVKATDFADWAEEVEEWLAEGLKNSKSAATRMLATLEGLTGLDSGTTSPAVEVATINAAREAVGAAALAVDQNNALISDLNAERDQKGHELDQMEQGGSTSAPARALADLETEKAKVIAAIRQLAEREQASKQGEQRAAGIRQNLDAAKTRLEAIRSWLTVNDRPAQLDLETLPPVPDMFDINEACDDAAKLVLNAERELAVAAAAILTGDKCACCGAPREAWDEATTWQAQEHKTTVEGRLAEAKGMQQAAHKRRHEALTIQTAHDDQSTEKLRHQTATEAWETKSEQATHTETLISSLSEQLASLPTFSPEDAEELSALFREEGELDGLIAQHKTHADYHAACLAMDEITAKLDHAELAAPQLAQELEDAQANATSLDTAKAEHDQAQAQAATRKQATDEHKKAADEQDGWNKALGAFRDTCKAETIKIFEPLLVTVRKLTRDCLPTELSNRGLEFGRFEGAHFIPYDAFSKSEQAVTLAGITAALAAEGTGVVIIDELNNVDAAKQIRLVANLTEALADGTIAQAILLDNQPVPAYTLPQGAARHTLAA